MNRPKFISGFAEEINRYLDYKTVSGYKESVIFRITWVPRSSFLTAGITRSAGRTATKTAARSGKTSQPLTIRGSGVQGHDTSGLLRPVIQPV